MIQRAVVGFLTLLLMVSATFGEGSFIVLPDTDIEIATSQTADANGEEQDNQKEEYKYVAYEAVLPLLHANLTPLHCTFTQVTIIVVRAVEEIGVFEIPHIPYFNTLFRLIISPNAP